MKGYLLFLHSAPVIGSRLVENKAEIATKVGHNPLLAFVELLSKDVVKDWSVAAGAKTEESYEQDLLQLRDLAKNSKEMFSLPPSEVVQLLALGEKIEQSTEKLSRELSRITALPIDLYLLSAVLYPHYLTSSYPADKGFKETDYRKRYTLGLGVVDSMPEEISLAKHSIGLFKTLESDTTRGTQQLTELFRSLPYSAERSVKGTSGTSPETHLPSA